jgi:hypothetical protein
MAGVTLNLGGTDLNNAMLWSDRFAFQEVAQTVARTLGGQVVTFVQGLSKGRPITLVANEQRGWLTKDQVDAIQVMAQTVGGVFTLQVESETFQVQFRHEEPPAFEALPLVPDLAISSGTFPDPTATYFTATIKLMEV